MSVLIKEHASPASSLHHSPRRHPQGIDHVLHLFKLILPWKDRHSSEQLGQDTASAPSIDVVAIRNSERDFRGSVVSGLNICVNSLILETTRAEVDHLYSRLVVLLQKNVLWLQVAVDYVLLAKELQTHKDLDGEPSDELLIESVVIVPDNQLVKVIAEELEYYADVLPKNNKIFYPYDILLLLLVDFFDMAQDLYLHKGLLGELGFVFDDLQSHFFLLFVVESFEDLSV